MSVELISVLVAVLGNRGDFGRADPDQQSRVAAGHGAAGWEDRRAGIAAARRTRGRWSHGCERTPVSCETTSSN